MTNTITGYADLKTGNQAIPIVLLGEGRVVSNAFFRDDFKTVCLVWASLHDSAAYGTPSYWFGENNQTLFDRIINIEPVPEAEVLPFIDPETAILRRVVASEYSIRRDMDYTSRYVLGGIPPSGQPLEDGRFKLIPYLAEGELPSAPPETWPFGFENFLDLPSEQL